MEAHKLFRSDPRAPRAQVRQSKAKACWPSQNAVRDDATLTMRARHLGKARDLHVVDIIAPTHGPRDGDAVGAL